MFDVIYEDLMTYIIEDLSIINYMVLMTSCKFLYNKRMKYINYNNNYNTFNMFHVNKNYFNTIFNSHIKEYTVCVNNIPLEIANKNTTIVLSFNHYIEKNEVEKFKIKKAMEKYFKTQLKNNFNYMMSNKLSINACKLFQKIIKTDIWNVTNINIFDIFTCIHHIIYQNYDLLQESLFNIAIYDIDEKDESNSKLILSSSLKLILSTVDELHKKNTKYYEIIKILLIYIIYCYCDKMIKIMLKRNFGKVLEALINRTELICFQLKHNLELPEYLKDNIIKKIKTIDIKIQSYI